MSDICIEEDKETGWSSAIDDRGEDPCREEPEKNYRMEDQMEEFWYIEDFKRVAFTCSIMLRSLTDIQYLSKADAKIFAKIIKKANKVMKSAIKKMPPGLPTLIDLAAQGIRLYENSYMPDEDRTKITEKFVQDFDAAVQLLISCDAENDSIDQFKPVDLEQGGN